VPVGAWLGVWVVAAGVLGGQLAPWTPTAGVLTVAAGIAVGAGCVLRRHSAGWLALALLAAAVGVARLETVRAPTLPEDDVARLRLPTRGILEGTIHDLRRGRGGRAVLLVDAGAVVRGGTRRPVGGRVRLTVRRGLPKVRPGDDLRVETTLRAPRNFANPGGFDLVGHLARQGVRVTASVWDGGRLERRPRPTRGAVVRLRRWRARLARVIERSVPAPAAAVIEALVLGADDRIDRRLREAFTRAGVVHVLSVSGLHVGLVAAASYGLVRWLLARSERVLLRVDVRRVAALISLVPVGLYGTLAGFEVATLRAVLMAGLGVVALLGDRPAAILRLLALAAVAIALGRPGAPSEIGYQLSFVSVAALALGVRRWAPGAPAGARGRLRQALVVATAASLGTAPLTARHFQQVAPMGVLANPLVVPLFGSMVVGPGLVGAGIEPWAPALASRLFALAGMAVRPGVAVVEVLGGVAWAALDVPRPDVLELVLLYGLLVALACPPGRHARRLALLTALALAVDAGWWVRARWAPGVLRVTFLDVGQGDATVVELPDGRVLVVDAGGFPGSDFDTGRRVVAPYLATRKIRHIDVVVMTHAHPDHFGGVASLVRRGRVGELWWTGRPGTGAQWRRLIEAIAGSGVRVRTLARGDTPPGFASDTIEVLHPPRGWSGGGLNDSSLTLRLRAGGSAVLLTGDIEAGAEASLRRSGAARLAAPVLKAPHHGSRTSSTGPFLDAVGPRLVVVPVGANNRYGLPASEVEARYRARGYCVLRTDRCGAITVVANDGRLGVTAARATCRCPAGWE
jgi:competence protein ComEC